MGCSYSLAAESTEIVDFAAGTAALTLDGSVTTTRPDPTSISVSASMYATSGYTPNPYGDLVYSFMGWFNNLSTGAFTDTWSQAAQFPGPVTRVQLSLTIGGLQNGDSLTMPGSMGMYLAAPVVSDAPEPRPSEFLLGAFAVAGLRYMVCLNRRRHRALRSC